MGKVPIWQALSSSERPKLDTCLTCCPKHPGSAEPTGPHLSAACQVSGQRLVTSSRNISSSVAEGINEVPGSRMTGPTLDPVTPVNRVARNNDNPDDSLSLQDQILDQMSSLKALIKQHNDRAETLVEPIRLTFSDEGVVKARTDGKGVEEKDEVDLQKPYKEVLKSSFTRRIIEFSTPSHRMPTNLKIYDGFTDSDDHVTHFMGAANQEEWQMPEKFVERFALRRKCCKDHTKVSKIIRRANETLPDFKERWTEEMSYIQDVSEVMQISTFMSNSKCPELARRLSDQVPKTVTEMMKKVDDFVKSEEAFKSTKLPRGEFSENGQGTSYRGSRPYHAAYEGRPHRTDNYSNFNHRDQYQPYVPPRVDNRRYDIRRQEVNHLSMDSLIKNPQEILAIELQLQLPPCPSMIETPKKENLDRGRSGRLSGEKGVRRSRCASPSHVRTLFRQFTTTYQGPSNSNPDRVGGFLWRTINSCRESGTRGDIQKKEENRAGGKERRGITEGAGGIRGREGACPSCFPGAEYHNRYTILQRVPLAADKSAKKQHGHICMSFRREEKVEEWVKDGIVRPYPLSEIDLKIEAVMGFPFKCFLDAYKGYLKIQIYEDDEEKAAFYTDQGTNCYTKMSFGLKNVVTTYQRDEEIDYRAANIDYSGSKGNIGVLVAGRKGKQTPILLHGYFEAHPIKVIIDQPIKQILNKPEVSEKLAKYVVELGAYSITYVPRTAIKGQRVDGKVPYQSKRARGFLQEVFNKKYSPEPKSEGGCVEKVSFGPLSEGPDKLKFIIVAIDYFTKWIKVKPLAKTTGKEVQKFVWENIVCRFGVPRVIVTDNGTQLVNDLFKSWCEKWKIKQMNTAVAHHKPTFSLTYGSEAVITAEIGMPTYRIIQFNEAQNEEDMRLNLDL
uniref:Reverse transcriptase domain-containing protein n=1 Tax=Tanacetum cinerariifolium TaxID=118510 RepID=A0A6L2LLU2_TANCI|nr:reverse transcriptase domain-containing protein [Tanacetum cinerariifolium]